MEKQREKLKSILNNIIIRTYIKGGRRALKPTDELKGDKDSGFKQI